MALLFFQLITFPDASAIAYGPSILPAYTYPDSSAIAYGPSIFFSY